MRNVKETRDRLLQVEAMSGCPTDFDAYWDKAIAEMEALGTDHELIPWHLELPGAECFHMWFTGVGGARIHCTYIRPKYIKGKVPAVCRFHGYGGDSAGDMMSRMAWAAAGFAVASLDCRGQNGLSEDVGGFKGITYAGHFIRGLSNGDPEKLLYRAMYLDTAQLVRILASRPEIDSARIGAYGDSQGGGLTLACAALSPMLNSAAPIMPFLCDYRRVWETGMDGGAYVELRNHFRVRDPLHEHEEEIFNILSYIDNVNLARRIRARVLMQTGLVDSICPPETQFAAYNRITSPKDVVLYPDYAHDDYPGSMDRILEFMLQM